MAYCTAGDLRLGDLQLPQTQNGAAFSVQPYLDRAELDINNALGSHYVVPIVSANAFTNGILKAVNADLAAGYLVLAQAQGGEDNQPNAYGLWLIGEAKSLLDPFVEGFKILPGAPVNAEFASGKDSPISVVQEDAASLLAAYEVFVTTPNPYAGEFYGPWTGRYGDGFQ